MTRIIFLVTLLITIACNTKLKTIQKDTTMKTGKPADWIKTINVYEVNLRQYTKEGTFNAFLKELPRLKDMGVQALWFMPITPISQKNKKGTLGSYYAAADYTSINPEFGTLDDFKNLVRRAHEQGFKVIIDWVANHTGWDHVWTKQHPEYYKMDPVTKDFAMASGMDDIIELDFNKPELRKTMIDAMRFWINETGIDGFRCDLAFWVELPFWVEAKAELEKGKRLFWLGELDPLDHPEYMTVFDAAYTWTWMHKTEEFYKNKLSVKTLESVLERYQHTNGMKAWFTTNHDENSWNGTEYEKYGDAAKAFAVFSCTWPGVPLIYSGQELPNRKRLKFFEKDVIDWKDDYQLHSFYQTLLKLHSENPALNGDHTIASVSRLNTSADDKAIAFRRRNENHEVVVLLNLSNETIYLEIKDQRIEGKFTEVFSKLENNFLVNRNFKMDPWSYLVFEK